MNPVRKELSNGVKAATDQICSPTSTVNYCRNKNLLKAEVSGYITSPMIQETVCWFNYAREMFQQAYAQI